MMKKNLKNILFICLTIAFVLVGFNYKNIFLKPKYRSIIEENMIDPTSVLFRNETFKDGFMCGEYNAKNRMGAYTGFHRFISNGKAAFSEENEIYKDFIEKQNFSIYIAIISSRNAEKDSSVKSAFDYSNNLRESFYKKKHADYEDKQAYFEARESLAKAEFEYRWLAVCSE